MSGPEDRLADRGEAPRWPIGLVPLRWPNPQGDLDGFLAAVTELGFHGVQLGRPGSSPASVRARFERHSMQVAELYFAIRCTSDGPAPDALDEGRQVLGQASALGSPMLVTAIDGSAERDCHAGRASGAPALTSDAWRGLTELLRVLAQEAAEVGVATSFHPHAGTFVETPEETERLLELTDPALVRLCLDTGHWLIGGGDPVDAVATYGDRLSHVHLKDVDGDVLQQLRGGGIGTFTEAVERVVFGPLGSGVLELDPFIARLRDVGYHGWIMVEQDSFVGTAAAAAAASRAALGAALGRLRPAADR